MLINLNSKKIRNILQGREKNENQNIRVNRSNDIRRHVEADIDLVRDLIQKKYPSENDEILRYRLENVKLATRKYIFKIFSILQRISEAADFHIDYVNEKTRIILDEKFNNFQHYVFNQLLLAVIKDANAVYTLMLDNMSEQYIDIIFYSHDIIFYDDEYMIVHDYHDYEDEYQHYIYIDDTQYVYFHYRGEKLVIDTEYININEARNRIVLGGLKFDEFYESLISGTVADFDSVLILENDISHAIKQHIFPERWKLQLETCHVCQGHGKIKVPFSDDYVSCNSCTGTGRAATNFSEHVLDLNALQEISKISNNIPLPFVGYVEKNINIVDFLQTEIERTTKNALAAINMEFLAQVQLNESGIAKEYDRAELKAFLLSVSKTVSRTAEKIAQSYLAYFHEYTYNQYSKIKVNYASDFDYLFNSDIESETQIVNNTNISAITRKRAQIDIIEEKYDDIESKIMKTAIEIDEFSGYTLAEKIELYGKNLITEKDIYISINSESIVRELVATNPSFIDLNLNIKKIQVTNYVESKIKSKIPKMLESPHPNISVRDETSV